MWSLYAQNTGFRLEFDVRRFPFAYKGPFPINYREKLPILRTSEWGVPAAALVQTNVKYASWSYENEWRLLIYNAEGLDMKAYGPQSELYNLLDDHDRKYRYPLTALKSITLGCDFFRDAQLEYRLFVVGDEMNVMYPHECLQTQLLDFLVEVQKKYPLKVYLACKTKYGTLEDVPVVVIKLSKRTYHFVETE